jgi:hypothetical protein
MVTRATFSALRRRQGVIIAELLVAVSLLLLAMLPLSVAYFREQAGVRSQYQRAVAMEIVDGEMEALLAGGWRAYQPGSQPYLIRADAAKVLPPGRFILTLADDRLRLEWRPDARGGGGPFAREVVLKK